MLSIDNPPLKNTEQSDQEKVDTVRFYEYRIDFAVGTLLSLPLNFVNSLIDVGGVNVECITVEDDGIFVGGEATLNKSCLTRMGFLKKFFLCENNVCLFVTH